jgi:hypothetical protein
MSRDLWQEVKASDSESRRKAVEFGGRILYSLFIVTGGFLALDLYTRPEPILLKMFGVAAAILLVVSDIFWSLATHHSAAGGQRITSYVFWFLGLTIFALNVVTEYLHYLNQPLGWLESWYFIGSISTVVVAAFGWAFYLLRSPEQKLADVSAEAKSTAVSGLMRGITHPDEETKAIMNEPVNQAAHDLAAYAAQTVHSHIGALISKNGKSSKSLAMTIEPNSPPEKTRPNA